MRYVTDGYPQSIGSRIFCESSPELFPVLRQVLGAGTDSVDVVFQRALINLTLGLTVFQYCMDSIDDLIYGAFVVQGLSLTNGLFDVIIDYMSKCKEGTYTWDCRSRVANKSRIILD